MVGAKFLTSSTKKEYLVIGMVTPVISISWKESFPIKAVPTLQVMATMGIESM